VKFPVEQEAALMERIFAMRDDPIAFVTFAYPWGEQGTPLADIPGPWEWQVEELEALAAHMHAVRAALAADLPMPVYRKAFSSGRGPGKSALFGMTAHWHLSCHLGAQGIVTANTETQLKTKTFPEIARWISMSVNAHWFGVEGTKVVPEGWIADLVKEQLKIDPKYWSLQGQTWTEENPDAFAGSHNAYGLLILFDEAAGIPAGVWDTADGFLTDRTPYRFHLAASQMRRTSGRFYDIFHSERFRRLWRTRSLDTRFVKCGVDPQWVADFIALHGEDSDEVRVEIRGVAPNQGEAQFIDAERVRGAQDREIAPGDEGAPLIMGVDPAPRGRTVIRFRQGRNARDCCGKDTRVVLQGADNHAIVARILKLRDQYNPDGIAVDFGMGTGVIDILRNDHRMRVTEVRFGEAPHDPDSVYATRAAELWGAIKEWLPGGYIDRCAELHRDLTAREWRWSGREDNKKKLEDKEELRSRGIPSPDDADALACTFAVSPPRRDSNLSKNRGVRVVSGVDEQVL
jgi:hypothetical protein